MKGTNELRVVELESLIGIQEEMLSENKRLRYLTVWLIALTVLLLGISVVTAACTL